MPRFHSFRKVRISPASPPSSAPTSDSHQQHCAKKKSKGTGLGKGRETKFTRPEKERSTPQKIEVNLRISSSATEENFVHQRIQGGWKKENSRFFPGKKTRRGTESFWLREADRERQKKQKKSLSGHYSLSLLSAFYSLNHCIAQQTEEAAPDGFLLLLHFFLLLQLLRKRVDPLEWV